MQVFSSHIVRTKCAMAFNILLTMLMTAIAVSDISLFKDDAYVDLPYIYEGYLGAKLSPEIAVVIITDPCHEFDAGCCATHYGAMEYFPADEGVAEFQADRMCLYLGRTYPIECLKDRNDELISYDSVRISDYDYYYNPDCKEYEVPTLDCVGSQTARRRSTTNPKCWDHNDTIDSRTTSCRLEDGTTKDYCLEFAFATNAFVMECRGVYESDLACGTFVELHRVDEELYFAYTKIPQGLYTGFNDVRMGIDLTIFGGIPNATIDGSVTGTKVLCRGKYELWWVQRTREHSYVLYRKPFEIINPECDWSLEVENFQLFTAEQNLYIED